MVAFRIREHLADLQRDYGLKSKRGAIVGGQGRVSQVGQALIYLLAVQLENFKKKRHFRPLLGLHIEGNEIHTLNGLFLEAFDCVRHICPFHCVC